MITIEIMEFSPILSHNKLYSSDIDELLDVLFQTNEFIKTVEFNGENDIILTDSLEKINDEFLLTVNFWMKFTLN